jgi:Domain of unknown function (DUF6438)
MKIQGGNFVLGLISVCLWCVPTVHGQSQAEAANNRVDAIAILNSEADEHLAFGRPFIHSSDGIARISLKLVVTPGGAVKSATPESGSEDSTKWHEQAASLAKTWQYVPFEREGKPIFATFSADVNVVPPESRPHERRSSASSFPEIKDWNSLRITLNRTKCYGICPSYTLTVSGEGDVIYHGDAYVRYCGDFIGHVSHDVVLKLFDLFKKADYFNAFDRYEMRVTDTPTYTTSIAFDNMSKSVIDYDGLWVGMPDGVWDIEDGLDRIAGPKVWAKTGSENGDVNYRCPK